jgi:hypothetical protein
VTNLIRRSVTSAAVAAVAALTLALLTPGALAAARPLSVRVGAGLHKSGQAVLLGPFKDEPLAVEAPNGTVYDVLGREMFVVHGTTRKPFHSVSGRVIAGAATNTDVFAEIGLTVYEYSTAAHLVRDWKLTSPVKKITSAGLVAVGSTLWSWTDWSTDASGLEYATVSAITTTSSKVKVISKSDVFPFYVAASSAGLYYEIATSKKAYLVLTTPSGVTKHRTAIAVPEDPIALSPGRVNVLTENPKSFHLEVASYRSSNLASLDTKAVANNPFNIAGTSAGLLTLWCGRVTTCSKAQVGVLNPATGAISGQLAVPYAFFVMPGPAPAVLTEVGANAYLVRLS